MQGFEQLLTTVLGIDPKTIVARLEALEDAVGAAAKDVGLNSVSDLITRIEAIEEKIASIAETVEALTKTAITVADPTFGSDTPASIVAPTNPPTVPNVNEAVSGAQAVAPTNPPTAPIVNNGISGAQVVAGSSGFPSAAS